MGDGGSLGSGMFSEAVNDVMMQIEEKKKNESSGRKLPDMPSWGSRRKPKDWNVEAAKRTAPVRRTEGNSAWSKGKSAGGLANALRANSVTTGRNTNIGRNKGE